MILSIMAIYEAPVKILDTKTWLSFLGWQYPMCYHILVIRKANECILTSRGEDNRIFMFGTFPNLALCTSLFGWFTFALFYYHNNNYKHSTIRNSVSYSTKLPTLRSVKCPCIFSQFMLSEGDLETPKLVASV